MSNLPDRIVYDAEFIDDDEQPSPSDTAESPAAADTPGTGRRITAAVAAVALRVARREMSAAALGLKVLKTERGRWLNAADLTEAHLRVDLLNRRYRKWHGGQAREAERLSERAKEAEKLAARSQRRSRTEDAAPADHERAVKEATAQRAEAVAWRDAARQMETAPYTGHREPAPEELSQHRRRTANRRRVRTALAVTAVTAVELQYAGTLPLLTVGGITVAAWAKGRIPGWRTTPPDVPGLAYNTATGTPAPETVDPAPGTVEDPPKEEEQPYPIAGATTAEEAEEALRRAIKHEGGDVEAVTGARREPWGWSARVTFTTGSPDDLNKEDTYKGLITLLKLRRNGLLIEGDPEAGDSCTVRMVMRDPFTPELVGTVPYRAPLSMSIVDMAEYGVAMDATPLTFTLAGLMLLMVADSGGGKSGVMLALGEVATACRDAAVINIDPAGTGIGDLGPAITLNACMDDDTICTTLEFLLSWCTARARQRARYGWGNKWRVSPEHPAICAFVDEWPQLSPKAKALLIRLLLLGRKEAIWVYAGSQYGTKDYLGEAIGPKLSAKLIGACRRVDVTELMGAGALTEGYRADLIQAATHTQTNDAGQIYAQGLPGMPNKPMRYQVREISPEYAHRVATERETAGLPDVTHTLTEAGLINEWNSLQDLCAAEPGTSRDDRPDVPAILALLHEMFLREGEPEFLTMDQVHEHLRKDDPEQWGKWDDRDDTSRLRELGKTLARMLRNAGVELSSERITELDGQPRGYYLETVEQAMDPTD
ncbi:hypothetical protein [Streptomyces malaysiensis]|uniref:hypothetical protein n=1 Tax=Streptomyces malaysiensis TaxID=92644 RepID=UPI0008537842|nr:hypothetical protein [Streptomyces sp. SPMA113]